MMKRIVFLSMLAGTALGMASSLAVYQDKTVYTYTPHSSFIGLTKNIKAKCEGESVLLESMTSCPPAERFCSLFEKAEHLDEKIIENSTNTKVLEQLISLPQPTNIDASSWIEAAKEISREKTRLSVEKKNLIHESRRLKQIFSKQTRAAMPLHFAHNCDGETELILPYGYITFSTVYEAKLLSDKIHVIQKLSIRNRSGIDIKADEAYFYYRSAQQYVTPVHFVPWTVGERKEYIPQKAKYSAKRVMEMDTLAVAAPAPAPVQATYEDAREYSIKGLDLPSTGESKMVPVMEWKTPVKCQTELFPYRHTDAFEVCSFKPKFQIEQNSWKVSADGRIVNEDAVGEYEKGEYRLYTQVDQDIQATREKVVEKNRETGIFGGTARKKDGFVLTIVNKSDKMKKLVVTERIPTSKTEKIKVKLLSVHSAKNVDYNLLKDGKLKMNVVLAPNETRKIEVLFEISYDKDLKIDY